MKTDLVIAKEVSSRTRFVNGRESYVGQSITMTATNRTGGKTLTAQHLATFLRVAMEHGAPEDTLLVAPGIGEGSYLKTLRISFSVPQLPDEEEPTVDGGAV